MDSSYVDQRDSRQFRFRTDSHLSSTTSQFQGLLIETNPITSSNHHVGISSSESATVPSATTATTFFSPPTPTFLQIRSESSTATGLSSPASQQYTLFPLLDSSDFDTDWSCITNSEAQSGNSLQLQIHPGQKFPGIEPFEYKVPVHSNSLPTNMSTLGIQHYDPQFDAGARPSYTWPRTYPRNSRKIGTNENRVRNERAIHSSTWFEPTYEPSYEPWTAITIWWTQTIANVRKSTFR